MELRPGERVLDLGCGSGWVTRLLARMVGDGPQGFGQVVGVDISDEMIRQARVASKEFDNVMFVVGSAAQIPWEENFFDKVLSVESFYYYPDQERALAELFRVMAPHGRLFILINLYKDNPYSLQWVPKLKVPVHVRSAAEYVELLKQHAFENVEYAQIPDDTPTPENYQTTSFHSLDDMKAFKRVGALLLRYRPRHFEFHPNWNWLEHGLGPAWKPFLLGCLVCGIISGFAGKYALELTWRLATMHRYRMRKERRRAYKLAG